MAEPFSPPNKEQLKKALQLYKDPIIYWATNTAVETLNRLDPNDIDIRENQYRELRSLLRIFIQNFGLYQIQELVYQINVEIADDYWKNFVPPIIKENGNQMISKEWKSG